MVYWTSFLIVQYPLYSLSYWINCHWFLKHNNELNFSQTSIKLLVCGYSRMNMLYRNKLILIFLIVETWDNLVFYCAALFTSKHCVSANHRNKPFITILLGSLARIYQNFSFWLENMYSTKRMGKFAELPPSFHTFRKVKLHLLNSRNLQLCWKLWFSSKSFLPR